jgi:hypothetical protein
MLEAPGVGMISNLAITLPVVCNPRMGRNKEFLVG